VESLAKEEEEAAASVESPGRVVRLEKNLNEKNLERAARPNVQERNLKLTRSLSAGGLTVLRYEAVKRRKKGGIVSVWIEWGWKCDILERSVCGTQPVFWSGGPGYPTRTVTSRGPGFSIQ
jgi:hypothetical protein